MSLKVKFEIHPLVATGLIGGLIILAFCLFRGCEQAKIELAAREKAEQLADSTMEALKAYKSSSDSSKSDFELKNELLSGQIELIKNQKDKAETALTEQIAINNALIEKHKLSKYTDTTAILVPQEYLTDCEGCFVNLEKTNKEIIGYKKDVYALQDKLKQQDGLYQSRLKQLANERTDFYNKMNALATKQKETADKLKPHGRLYLSWNVLFGPWPKMTGAGFLYQTKYNMMYEANWLYGSQGHMVYVSMKFPLSIKF